MFFTVPTLLTWTRIVAIPLLVGVFYIGLAPKVQNLVATVMFVVFALTDWLDGFLARTLHQTSSFGAFLDPVADKVMVAVVLVLMIERYDVPIFAIPAAVIVARELMVSALREWMAELGQRAMVAVSMIGKIKTTAQMGAIVILLAVIPEHNHPMKSVGFALLYIAVFLTLWSAFIYLRAAWPLLKAGFLDTGAKKD